EVARGNPSRSGELCVAGCVSAKKCLSLAVLIRQAARVRRDSGLLELADGPQGPAGSKNMVSG
ncbi:MAG: hypothetical protein NTY19_41530, partial [Planctomycetota bacterium]|nr:hypothetical protein [Planctomycetota bacterium]